MKNGAKHFDSYHPYFTLFSPNFQAASKPCKPAENRQKKSNAGEINGYRNNKKKKD